MSKLHKQWHKETRESTAGWGFAFIQAVKEIRMASRIPMGLRETLDLMANVFGFESWSEWQPWLKEKQLDFSMVQGPHALTILKAIAAKHGRRAGGGRK